MKRESEMSNSQVRDRGAREGFELRRYFGLQPSPGGERYWMVLTRECVDEWRREFPNDSDLDGLVKVAARHAKFPKGTRPKDLKQSMRGYLADLAVLEAKEKVKT